MVRAARGLTSSSNTAVTPVAPYSEPGASIEFVDEASATLGGALASGDPVEHSYCVEHRDRLCPPVFTWAKVDRIAVTFVRNDRPGMAVARVAGNGSSGPKAWILRTSRRWFARRCRLHCVSATRRRY